MVFWGVIGAALTIIALYPHLRCFIKRIIMACKLRCSCAKMRYRLHRTHFLWFLGGKFGKRCDFYIEMPNRILSVKLFGIKKRASWLIFKDDGYYFIRRFFSAISHIAQPLRIPIDGKPRKLPSYDFRYNFKIDWEIKTPTDILLINPVCVEIRRQRRADEDLLGAGDNIYGMTLFSLSHFLGFLEVNEL